MDGRSIRLNAITALWCVVRFQGTTMTKTICKNTTERAGRAAVGGAAAFVALCATLFAGGVLSHGDVTPQPVNTDGLEALEDWVEENPYRGNELAIEIGTSAYAQNCARCHGLDAVSGGITPDLRALNDEFEWDTKAQSDEWFIQRVRHGAVVQGRVYMPPFEGILSQEAMWAIRAYLDTRMLDE